MRRVVAGAAVVSLVVDHEVRAAPATTRGHEGRTSAVVGHNSPPKGE